MYKSIKDIKNLKDKKVLLKLDLNLSLDKNGRIDQDSTLRIESVLKTIKFLLSKKTKIVIISYLGRPNGFDKKYKMDAVSKILSKYIGKKIKKLDSALPQDIEKDILKMKSGDIIMLENIRFYSEEEKNDKLFAKKLAKLFNIYVNDSFSNAHRAHMSCSAIMQYLPSYAGFRLEEEIKNLSLAMKKEAGKILILGGAKVDTKLMLIKKLNNSCDYILLGGVLANTFLALRQINIGKSIYDNKFLKLAKKIDSKKIILPIDAITAKKIYSTKIEIKDIKNISDDDMILDIGPKSVELFAKYIKKSKMILWNGPMGYFENKKFQKGTMDLVYCMKKYKSIVYTGGGETVTMIKKLKLEKVFKFISTGGGAMLEFLSGLELPAIKALNKNKMSAKGGSASGGKKSKLH